MSPRVKATIEEIAAKHQFKVCDLKGHAKGERLWAARREAYAALRALSGPYGRPFSYPQIGAWLNKDHSSVLSGVRRFQELRRQT
jgi:chromosomal replication initiation ATPase DnaA